jgi:hypothetical protein
MKYKTLLVFLSFVCIFNLYGFTKSVQFFKSGPERILVAKRQPESYNEPVKECVYFDTDGSVRVYPVGEADE